MLTTTIAGKTVCRLGFGCYPLTGGYGTIDAGAARALLDAVLDGGVSILDTAEAYGAGANEELVGTAVARRRHSAVIVTKFGWVLDAAGNAVRRDSSPAHVRRSCDASLRRLKTDYIDVYLQHRVDPDVPIEETAGELARLRDEGKVVAYGVCEVSAATLARAAAAGAVVLQTEYSLWSREPEAELLPACDALGITFMAYSPLGRGFLAGAITDASQLEPADYRRGQPRYQSDNLRENRRVVEVLEDFSSRHDCMPSQLALAWLLNQGRAIVPIPSTRSIGHFVENLESLQIVLDPEDLNTIGEAVAWREIKGGRHPAEHMKTVNL